MVWPGFGLCTQALISGHLRWIRRRPWADAHHLDGLEKRVTLRQRPLGKMNGTADLILHERSFLLELRNHFVAIFDLCEQTRVFNQNVDEMSLLTGWLQVAFN